MAKALTEFVFLALAAMALAVPCSSYLIKIFKGNDSGLVRAISGGQSQDWRAYLFSVLFFNALGFLLLFLILRFQSLLPFNPQNFGNLSPSLAFNIAASFITNTGWQAYGGETTLSLLSQTAGLTAQNFLSAATGLAVAFAFVRGLANKENPLLGNFYGDAARIAFCVLLPLAILLSLFLIAQGVPQTMRPFVEATTLEGASQTIAMGPVASQTAIKIIGTNGGGFFTTGGAHPFENPTPLSNFAQLAFMLLLPMALVLAFGRMVGDKKQTAPLFACMAALFMLSLALCFWFERAATPAFAALPIDLAASDLNPGGNMEGKEVRFGLFGSVLWTVAATATSNGAVNSMLDSYAPLGGLVPLFNILLGETLFGGAGCGLYSILIYVLLTVFIAGLLVGRTPEYLGKKIEARDMQLALVALMLGPLCVLGLGAFSLLSPQGAPSATAYGPHGLTQTIYAYASASGNNGSAFAGFNANTSFQNILLGIAMLTGRFGVMIAVLALAGSLAKKKAVAASKGSFSTHGLLFAVLLSCMILLFGGLTYFPVLVLGPIAEHLSLAAGG